MQVELAAALGVPIFAGPPPVHSALSNRWTARNIFATAGIASPPGVPIAAKQMDAEFILDAQLSPQSGASGSPGNLSDVNNTSGHGRCAACHPPESVPFLAEYGPSEQTRLPGKDKDGAVNSPASAALHSAESSSEQHAANSPQYDLASASCRESAAEIDGVAIVPTTSSWRPSNCRSTAATCEAVIAEVCACCMAASGEHEA